MKKNWRQIVAAGVLGCWAFIAIAFAGTDENCKMYSRDNAAAEKCLSGNKADQQELRTPFELRSISNFLLQ